MDELCLYCLMNKHCPHDVQSNILCVGLNQEAWSVSNVIKLTGLLHRITLYLTSLFILYKA
mgnify:CR=1 FL=1